MSRMKLKQLFIQFTIRCFNYPNMHITHGMADKVETALSHARLSTYKNLCDNTSSAINLYLWNARISGAFLFPLHICEVVVRNAVSNALIDIYGDNWPWNNAFILSLPNPTHGYSPRQYLIKSSRGMVATNKVIPELKFIFWQNMFTKRYDSRIWNNELFNVIPNLDNSKPVKLLINKIYNLLESVRKFRNRIAHHEPIINRNLSDDYKNIIKIINYINTDTAEWVDENQLVTIYLYMKP